MAIATLIRAALAASPIVPVMTVRDIDAAVSTAEALIRGGLTNLEVTLRTPEALDAISALRAAFPEAVIGAGTITEPQHVQAAADAGAQFLVSPGVNARLVPALLESGLPAMPGVATVSEAMSRADEGFEIVKLFPAQAVGGVKLLKSISAPLPHLTFMPTGGITAETAGDFLALENVIAVGGSWMLGGPDIFSAALAASKIKDQT
ncbi:MAG: bifunctional 4-hydroxy-2-oxoglutarate aldolase/2-dehydro-3-deoxy-phosphogluconate aldolase [Pseudomonadota bacterium]